MAKLANKTLIIISCIIQIHLALSLSRESRVRYDEEIKNPCKIAKQRKLPKEFPVIRVIDEIAGENPDVLLGQGGITYYMLPATTQSEVVIECSSSFDRVEWVYRGRGVSLKGLVA